MKIRLAKQSDKKPILEFCRNTFSWGDYIEDAWDTWIKESNLFVLENDIPFGISHAYFSNNQVWIEGIRINPKYRRKHYASKLIKKIETIAKQKRIMLSFMLTDVKNTPSILMAKKCGYILQQTWNFYSLKPKTCSSYQIQFTDNPPEYITHYVKSWRWLPLTSNKKRELSKKNKIITANTHSSNSYAIMMDSTHFGKTLVVALYSGSKLNTAHILCYIQDFAFSNNYQRIEILTKEKLKNFTTLKLETSFNLFNKNLD